MNLYFHACICYVWALGICLTCMFNFEGIIEIKNIRDNKLFDWYVRYINIL